MKLRSVILLLLFGVLAFLSLPSPGWMPETSAQGWLPASVAATGASASCTPDLDGDGLCQEDSDGDAFVDDQCPSESGPARACGCPVEVSGRPVELVLAVDTTSTVSDELFALCSGISSVVADLQAKGIDVHYQILGIAETSGCISGVVANLVGDASTNHPQDWGPAVRDLSAGWGWQSGRIRLVITVSDAGAEDGGTPWNADDTRAIDVAILAARSNGVRAAPVLASGAPAGADAPSLRLASNTGGRVIHSTDPDHDLLAGIAEVVESVALDADGDGVSDCKDADAQDRCIPQLAFCLPAQDCGVSNTPNRDDDRDGEAGEETDDDVDTDGDGLSDEDVGGVGCAFPTQDCGVNSSRNLDDDRDGAIDEEIDDGLDDDGDGYIDEDVACACPAEQDTGIDETLRIDDDHDGGSDEEADDGIDNDGDGCVDEDIATHQLGGLAMRLCSGSPLPGLLCPVADVVVKAGAIAQAQTGMSGAYDLKLDPGIYDLEFSSPGFLTAVREGVSVEVSERARIDSLMIPEECAPPADACHLDYQALAPLWMPEMGALDVTAESHEFLNGACRYAVRADQGRPLRAAAGMVLPTMNVLDSTSDTELQLALGTLADCLQMDLYTLLDAAGAEVLPATQELHRYAEWDDQSSTLVVAAMPATVTSHSQLRSAEVVSDFYLHVHDLRSGGHLGRVGDVVERTIPSSYLIDMPIQIAFVHDAQSEYLVEIVGAGASHVDIALMHPRSSGAFGRVLWQQITTTISSTASLSVGLNTVQYHLDLDLDGDGDIDQELAPAEAGALEYDKVYLPVTLRASSPTLGTPNLAPNVPGSLWPVDGSVRQSLRTKLSWLGGDPDWDHVTYYVFLEAGDDTPDVMVCNGTSQSSCDPGPLDAESDYYWQVWARDEHGAVTAGPVWRFGTGSVLNHAPNPPRKPSPPDGAVNQGVHIDLSWTGGDSDGDVVTYDVYLGLADPPTSTVCADTSDAICDPGSLSNETHYYWSVEATDELGETTTGPVWEFATESYVPGFSVSKEVSPSVVGPGDLLTYTVHFSNGGDVAGRIERVDDVLPVGFLFQGMGANSDVGALPDGITGTITWQGPFTVSAHSALDIVYGVQATATLGSFVNSVTATMGFGHLPPGPGTATVVVTNRAPITPALPSPADGTTVQRIDVDLSWVGTDPDGDLLTYDVYFDLWNPPTILVCDDATNPTCDPGTLDFESSYYWAVNATDDHGLTTFGPTWSFSTGPDLRGICFPVEPIVCDATDSGNNGGPGSTNYIDSYPCAPLDEIGPEYAYRFVPQVSGRVSVTLTNLTADLDVFVLDGAGGQCLADNCIGSGDAAVAFEARAGQTYYLVVDGRAGAVGDYTIETSCIPSPVQADLAIRKSAAPDPVFAGTSLTYTLWISNTGPSEAGSVLATDDLPDGVMFDATSSSPLCGEIGGTVSCELGPLGNGAEIDVGIVVTVGLGASGLLPNSAHVTSYEYDPNDSSNQHSIFSRVFGPGGICAPARSIGCGESVSASNAGPGATDLIDYYSCAELPETGPEVAYTFVPDVSGQVTAVLGDLSADLDLFVLRDDNGSCNSGKCLAYGNDEVSFSAIAGQTYYLVVDGFIGAVSNYTLTVDCQRPNASQGLGPSGLVTTPFSNSNSVWADAWLLLDPDTVRRQSVCWSRTAQ